MNEFQNGQIIQKVSSNRDILIIIAVIWIVFSRFFYSVISFINVDIYTTDLFKYTNALFSIIWGFIPLLLAFSVKDRMKQVVLFALAAVYIVMTAYDVFQQFMNPFM